MVAPRSHVGDVPYAAPTIDPVELLAWRWVELSPAAEPGTSGRLAAVLRRLAAVVATDPFRPPDARSLGVELFATGLCGRPDAPAPGSEDVLAAGLGLIRHGRAALGARAGVGRQRLDVALDELAAGFARGLRDRAPGDAPAQRPASLTRPITSIVPEQRSIATRAERDARSALLTALRGGVGRGEFRLVYQPLVTLPDGRVRGAEALVRWQHPVEGLIGPGRFIRLAETSGVIVPLGHWVLAAACTQAVAWAREIGPDAPYVSVNVSPVQLVEDGWVDEVQAVLVATGLPAHRLQLEITEQAVLGDEVAALAALTALRDSGVRLALDDFGTGYSSLAWLRRLPVHALKIDGSFVDGLRHAAADPVDLSIVRALVELAHALGLEVTAEWVETGAQAERLAALGCDLAQGRWFGDAGPGEWVPQLSQRTLRIGG